MNVIMNTIPTSSNGSNHQNIHLHDLPDALLVDVAKYLPPPSRALFATAMTASADSWEECDWQKQPSSASKAIMMLANEKPWEDLDVGRMGLNKWKLIRLTDGELGGLLVCIDAVNKLKSLSLTHCFGITGAGLKPLSGSNALKSLIWVSLEYTRAL